MEEQTTSELFPLGATVITANAFEKLNAEDVAQCIARHARGDWGDLTRQDGRANMEALRDGHRLLSGYRDRAGTRFWIITEADRSVTTVLLPEDY